MVYNTSMKTKQIINGQWVFSEPTESLKVGDTVTFSCNGRGRGGHYHVTSIVTDIKSKTFLSIESHGSYRPGTIWKMSLDAENLYLLK